MRLINFTFDSSVELGFSGHHRYLDLHNCFEWQGLSYRPDSRRIEMSWVGFPNELPRPTSQFSLTLVFRGVSSFTVCPRDPEMPFTEDSCLHAVTFTPPERASDFEGEYRGYRSDLEHITFLFQSGFGVKIWAEEVELIYDRAPNTALEPTPTAT